MARNKKPQEARPGTAVEPMVVMGHIVGPYGLSGWIKVFPYTEYIDGLADYPVWWLGSGNGEWRNVKVNASGVHGNRLTALLEQCADRNAATDLKGLQIAIPRSQLPVLSNTGKDGYYWSDLIGLEIVNQQGEALGQVTGLLETGANDVLQVQNLKEPERERLIPFISQVIVKVDFKVCRITVDWGVDY